MSERKHILTNLARLAQQQPDTVDLLERVLDAQFAKFFLPAVEVALETGEPMGNIAARAFASNGTEREEDELRKRFPLHETTSLLRLSLSIYERGAERLASRIDPVSKMWRAMYRRNSARCHYELGNVEKAADIAEDAAVAVRQLILRGQNADLMRVYWCCLSTLALTRSAAKHRFALWEDGHRNLDRIRTSKSFDHPDASPLLVQNQFCVEEMEAVTRRVEDKVLVAGVMRQKLQDLLQSGGSQEALYLSLKLLELTREEKTGHSRYAFLDLLGFALDESLHMKCLAALGRLDEAIELGDTVLEYYRDGEEEQPDIFGDRIARFIQYFSRILALAGQHGRSESLLVEAIARYREYSASRPDYFQELAGCLTTMGGILTQVNRYDEAAAYALESVKVYERLVAEREQKEMPADIFWVDERVTAYQLAALARSHDERDIEARDLMNTALMLIEKLQLPQGNSGERYAGEVLFAMVTAYKVSDFEQVASCISFLIGLLEHSDASALGRSTLNLSFLEILPLAARVLNDSTKANRLVDVFENMARSRFVDQGQRLDLIALRVAAHCALETGDRQRARKLAYRGAEISLTLPTEDLPMHDFSSLLNAAFAPMQS